MSKDSLKKQKVADKKAPVKRVTRKINDLTRLFLFVRAGGRCQFDGCNHYLLEHHVTLSEGNFAEMAHIVAFSTDGPRGKPSRPLNINDANNLMLLCPRCHKLIDDAPDKFTVSTLQGYKMERERMVQHLTGLGPEQRTSVLVVKSRIGSQTVSIPFDHVLDAVSPRYPSCKEPFTIDLTSVPADSNSFTEAACDAIRANLQTFFGSNGDWVKTGHISLFGLGTIPVLMFLGTQLLPSHWHRLHFLPKRTTRREFCLHRFSPSLLLLVLAEIRFS